MTQKDVCFDFFSPPMSRFRPVPVSHWVAAALHQCLERFLTHRIVLLIEPERFNFVLRLMTSRREGRESCLT